MVMMSQNGDGDDVTIWSQYGDDVIIDRRVMSSLVPRSETRRKGPAWFPLFAHALNHGGIPPAPRMFDNVCTLVTSERILNIAWSVQLS